MRSFYAAVCAICLVGTFVPAAQAQFVDELTFEFSGAQTPSGTPPWGRATFQGNMDGSVTLTLENLLQGAGEFFDKWLFNLNTTLTPSALTFAYVSGQDTSPAGTVTSTDLHQDADGNDGQFKADGDGYYDIKFDWTTNAFVGGETSVWTITSSEGDLVGNDFGFESIDGAGPGTFFSAAHVGGLEDPNGAPGNTDGSGWIASDGAMVIPAPGAMVLAALGLGLVGVVRKRIA